MFRPDLSQLLSSGSLVSFKVRKYPDTDQFRELQIDKERLIGAGIYSLRQIRTQIFESKDADKRQDLFKIATKLADQMADYCLADAADRGVSLHNHSYKRVLENISSSLADVEPLSKHHIVPSLVGQNLRKAAEDMLIRVENLVFCLKSPTRGLSNAESLEVLTEFVSGANNLSREARNDLFLPDTKVAGLLSGGLVYALMAKKVVERYGAESGTGLNVVAAAVDAENKQAAFERNADDSNVKRLIVVDDIIDQGGSILCAAYGAEDFFTGATINSGLSYSYAKDRVTKSQSKHLDHLSNMFQDFADLTESDDLHQAKSILLSAYQYAYENCVTLQRGWYKRTARYFRDPASLIGEDPYP